MSSGEVRRSLFDRLLASEPELLGIGFGVEALKVDVKHHLSELLNTRRISAPARGPYHAHLERSLYNYGLEDFSHTSPDTPGVVDEVAKAMKRAVETFEPRIRHVRVRPLGAPEGKRPHQIRFAIEGDLCWARESERVRFDTVLEVVDRRFDIEGVSDGS